LLEAASSLLNMRVGDRDTGVAAQGYEFAFQIAAITNTGKQRNNLNGIKVISIEAIAKISITDKASRSIETPIREHKIRPRAEINREAHETARLVHDDPSVIWEDVREI